MRQSLRNAQGPLVHIVAGLVLLTWLGVTNPLAYVFCGVVALLPDIDSQASIVGRLFPFISKPIERRFGHRQVTHSLLALVFVAGAAWLVFRSDWPLFAVAYASHFLIDMLVGHVGIPLLWPHQSRFYVARIRPGSTAELLLGIVLLVATLLPLVPGAQTVAGRLIPQDELAISPSPTPTPTVTPVVVNVRISHVHDPERDILVKAGDAVKPGDLLADLAGWRAQLPLTSTPAGTPSTTPTAAAIPTPSPTPPWTPDPLTVAEAEARLELARVAATASARAAHPDPENLAAAEGRLHLAERELQQRQAAYDKVAWRAEIAMLSQSLALEEATERHRIAQAEATAVARVDLAAIEAAQARLAIAQLDYQRALATPTPRPTNTPKPTATARPTPTEVPAGSQPKDPTLVHSLVAGTVIDVQILSVTGNDATVQISIQVPVAPIRSQSDHTETPSTTFLWPRSAVRRLPSSGSRVSVSLQKSSASSTATPSSCASMTATPKPCDSSASTPPRPSILEGRSNVLVRKPPPTPPGGSWAKPYRLPSTRKSATATADCWPTSGWTTANSSTRHCSPKVTPSNATTRPTPATAHCFSRPSATPAPMTMASGQPASLSDSLECWSPRLRVAPFPRPRVPASPCLPCPSLP
ncbi:MAG: metal-dependent hydrolase, partial [Chloroflexota bacterium]|nr:metal-dependent hydrolase [Chloroflexota bacterium]